MEKIYEEKSFSQDAKYRRKLRFSIVLSFVVAAFAIVSLIAVGFNQISYAAPSDSGNITLHFGMFSASTPAYLQATGSQGGLRVQMMFADSEDANTATDPLFCIEHGYDPSADDGAYESEGELFTDFGLVYILNQSSVLGGSGIVTGTHTYPGTSNALSPEDAKFLEYYATQAAIWMYMYETQPALDSNGQANPRHGKLEEDHQLDTLKGDISLKSSKNSNTIYSGNLYNEAIKQVVYDAQHATSYRTVQAHLESKEISKVGDDDTYQTDKITVIATPSNDLYGYYVDLEGLEGAYIVDSQGRTRTAYDRFDKEDYFFIRVPINKVTNDSSKVQVIITGEFNNFTGGDTYVATGEAQSVVKVTYERYRTYNIAEVNFMVAPDTGMTTAQTIYFIGLIVLLCGVGIIYANAKPVEE